MRRRLRVPPGSGGGRTRLGGRLRSGASAGRTARRARGPGSCGLVRPCGCGVGRIAVACVPVVAARCGRWTSQWPTRSRSGSIRRSSGGHEVDQLLDPAEQGRVEVGVGRHPAEDVLPGAGDVGLVGVRPAELLRRRRASTRSPRGTSGHAVEPEPLGLDRLPDVDERVADDRARARRPGSGAMSSAIRLSLEPGTRWSTSTPTRRSGPGPKSRRWSARSSTPPRYSTTTPSTRRSSPQTFSTSSASCRPSTKIRLARATRARAPCTATDPDAVRRRLRRGAPACTGGGQDHRPALEQEAGPEREGTPLAAAVLEGERCRGRGRRRRSRRTSRS